MREIKFRAWDEDRMFIFPLSKINSAIAVWLEHPDTRTMQYTGLKDKNGKGIYEGDIIEVDFSDYGQLPERFKMIWDERQARFVAGRPESELNMKYQDDWEVIGNIYENPELLNP